MGTLKKFKNAYALESVQFQLDSDITDGSVYNTIGYADVYGTAYSSIKCYQISYGYITTPNFSPYSKLVPVATSDLLSDYSLSDYNCSEIGTTTYSCNTTINNAKAKKNFVITIAAGSSDITVNCIKFKKTVYNDGWNARTILVMAYYLDAPLEISAGETETLTVELEIGE